VSGLAPELQKPEPVATAAAEPPRFWVRRLGSRLWHRRRADEATALR
jgi:hypothetical protein